MIGTAEQEAVGGAGLVRRIVGLPLTYPADLTCPRSPCEGERRLPVRSIF